MHWDPLGRKLDDAVVVVVAVGVVDGVVVSFDVEVVLGEVVAFDVDVDVVFADSVVVVFYAADVVFADELEF